MIFQQCILYKTSASEFTSIYIQSLITIIDSGVYYIRLNNINKRNAVEDSERRCFTIIKFKSDDDMQ